jgi:hypothetical protein
MHLTVDCDYGAGYVCSLEGSILAGQCTGGFRVITQAPLTVSTVSGICHLMVVEAGTMLLPHVSSFSTGVVGFPILELLQSCPSILAQPRSMFLDYARKHFTILYSRRFHSVEIHFIRLKLLKQQLRCQLG